MYKVFMTFALAALVACGSTAPESDLDREELHSDVQMAIKRFKQGDPGLQGWFDKAYAYAVFPGVGKGGVGVGGAYGRGEVYVNQEHVAYSTLTQATIGLQLGGQSYSEVIFFKDETAFRDFRMGNLEFSAQMSAVAVKKGASADADYSNGVAVFTMTKGGLMYEASVGGQSFDYAKK
jgi:lipid-binding SYLF domain-containing protein